VAQGFYQYPYASKWIALNMLSIDPRTVIVDAKQDAMIQALEQGMGMTVIPLELRHSRTLGGGFHCVTLDLHREP
jgi:glycine amidinotransferase/scyllo-inosamine-4-phosphate amidinotransferase 1